MRETIQLMCSVGCAALLDLMRNKMCTNISKWSCAHFSTHSDCHVPPEMPTNLKRHNVPLLRCSVWFALFSRIFGIFVERRRCGGGKKDGTKRNKCHKNRQFKRKFRTIKEFEIGLMARLATFWFRHTIHTGASLSVFLFYFLIFWRWPPRCTRQPRDVNEFRWFVYSVYQINRRKGRERKVRDANA